MYFLDLSVTSQKSNGNQQLKTWILLIKLFKCMLCVINNGPTNQLKKYRVHEHVKFDDLQKAIDLHTKFFDSYTLISALNSCTVYTLSFTCLYILVCKSKKSVCKSLPLKNIFNIFNIYHVLFHCLSLFDDFNLLYLYDTVKNR